MSLIITGTRKTYPPPLNIVVSLAGAFLIAPLGGMVIGNHPQPVHGQVVAGGHGGAVMSVALAGTMVVTLLGAWGALWIVNRWR